ncbi:hypothetical protein IC007_0861 [Sulfuracidifex tepidarius]|uniref:Uncharacterized protein n=2 Tax=Sulfuracidifex tepidarius TaxID=1294262 RepID=A0A510E1J3_9CREN|nr:hypothetical protein IC007_0861 [Sulfuracidifex tepidarius]
MLPHKHILTKIVEDKDGERFLELESREDLKKFREMVIEAYYELNPDRKRPCETQSPK